MAPMNTTRPLNPRLINTLRHASHPVAPEALAPLYQRVADLEGDVRVLCLKGIVQDTDAGLVWAGT